MQKRRGKMTKLAEGRREGTRRRKIIIINEEREANEK
jgi:hypothetical protein